MSTAQRVLLRLISALVALLLIAGSCLLIGQVVVGMTGNGDFLIPTSEWYDELRGTPWDDAPVVYVGVGLVIVGLLLLVVVLTSRPRLVTLAPPDAAVEVVIAPRTVAQMLRRQAEAVPGVGLASVEVTRDVARVTASVPLMSPQKVERELAQSLSHGLRTIPWSRTPRLELEVTGPPERDARGGSPGAPSNADTGAARPQTKDPAGSER